MRLNATILVLLLLAFAAAPALARDTVILKGGKKLENVVVSKQTDVAIVINPWNSRWPEMGFEIPDKNVILREKVEQVIVGEAPLVEYRLAASKLGRTADDHLALAKRCVELALKEEAVIEARHALALEPTLTEALLFAGGRGAWEAYAKGNPEVDPRLREFERSYLAAKTTEDRAELWRSMKELGTTRSLASLERARRSAAFPKGRREKVRLTMQSEQAPGATYCILLPKSYDPLRPTGLVVGLHGGGRGGVDPTLVTGSGEEAMPFYVEVAERYGVIVVCPTALAAGWPHQKNEPLLDALVLEMQTLYHVDENRIWLTGHSMGGGGTWHWGPKRAELWAAFAPCAGWGGPQTGGLPVYIYHGSDDTIVGPGSDRASARSLLGDKKRPDFVYTEVDAIGHGFPDWVVDDLFKFFTGRWKDRGKKRATGPLSSFLRKPGKEEIRCFGDPAAPLGDGAGGDGNDPRLSELIAKLEKGGGGGEEAVGELAKLHDAATVKAVARVLAARKGAKAPSADSRVLAARALGAIALPECVKPLAAAADDDEFRVVDVVATALGQCKVKEALDPLHQVARQMGAFFDRSCRGDSFVFTEYKIRCESFARLCDAYAGLAVALTAADTADAAASTAAAALPVLRDELVARVFTPEQTYQIPTDERFDEIPGAARLALLRRLRGCLETLATAEHAAAGAALLDSIAAAWPDEAGLVRECREGATKLRGG